MGPMRARCHASAVGRNLWGLSRGRSARGLPRPDVRVTMTRRLAMPKPHAWRRLGLRTWSALRLARCVFPAQSNPRNKPNQSQRKSTPNRVGRVKSRNGGEMMQHRITKQTHLRRPCRAAVFGNASTGAFWRGLRSALHLDLHGLAAHATGRSSGTGRWPVKNRGSRRVISRILRRGGCSVERLLNRRRISILPTLARSPGTAECGYLGYYWVPLADEPLRSRSVPLIG